MSIRYAPQSVITVSPIYVDSPFLKIIPVNPILKNPIQISRLFMPFFRVFDEYGVLLCLHRPCVESGFAGLWRQGCLGANLWSQAEHSFQHQFYCAQQHVDR
jgi:hypothetical protein